MKIPSKEYSFETFLEEFTQSEQERNIRLKIACFITSFSEWYDEQRVINLENVLKNYQIKIERLGEIRRLTTRYFDRRVNLEKLAIFYSYLDPKSKTLICFTDERQEVIRQTLENIAETATGFYYAFLPYIAFDKLRKNIQDTHLGSKCTYFSATYWPLQNKKSRTRPFVKRTIIYHGDDGLKSYDELSEFYGVHPTIMRYNIPGKGTYEIKNTGNFSLSFEEKPAESRKFLLHLSNLALEEVLVSRRIIESSHYELIPVKTDRKTFTIPKLTPWIVKFSQEIGLSEADALIETMSDNGFSIFNAVKEVGSLRLNGMVIDDKKHTIFSIDVDSTKMNIAPIGEISIDSFYRLYKVIAGGFDPKATCSQFGE